MAFSYFFNRTRKFWFHFGSLLDPHMNIYQSGFNIYLKISGFMCLFLSLKSRFVKRYLIWNIFTEIQNLFFSQCPPSPYLLYYLLKCKVTHDNVLFTWQHQHQQVFPRILEAIGVDLSQLKQHNTSIYEVMHQWTVKSLWATSKWNVRLDINHKNNSLQGWDTWTWTTVCYSSLREAAAAPRWRAHDSAASRIYGSGNKRWKKKNESLQRKVFLRVCRNHFGAKLEV